MFSEQPESTARRALVLTVDDDSDTRRLVHGTLTGSGFSVLACASGAEGITMAQGQTPDLILLDVDMPGMDGFETCRRLQADPATRNIPVIFLTAAGRSDKRLARGFGVGARDYIVKPFSRVDLSLRVMAAIQATLPAEREN
ncbi:MAG: response regulator [Planctomycetes bacterium]|nr:response regulator [Planctomycetota bacterium]